MKLHEINLALVRDAIRDYLEFAYDTPRERESHRPALEMQQGDICAMLTKYFTDESHYTEDVLNHRYVLRLGNMRYPHMKFVIEEFFIPGQYYFSVDSHDQLPITPDNPDYKQFLELRHFNADIKKAIEKHWSARGLPTLHNVREEMRGDYQNAGPTHRRILVVDDEHEMAETSRLMLESDGYDVTVVHSGPEALDAVEHRKPDLVLLDIQMPGMDGYQVCKRLRANPETKNIPILLATAAPGEMIYTMQADGFLCKPYNRRILRTFVEHVLGNHDDRDAHC